MQAPLIKLPQPPGEEATYPAALDGSPFGFYFSGSNTSTKWTINIQGGGWCYDEKDCLCRSTGSLGTSTVAKPTTHLGCSNPLPNGSTERDCNSVDLLYLDGASFSGYRTKPWPVPGTNKSLWFRGIKNLDATLDWLFEHGKLGDATEVLLKGESAGGLSTFLHADRVGGRLKSGSPKLGTYRASPMVGYFLVSNPLLSNYVSAVRYIKKPCLPFRITIILRTAMATARTVGLAAPTLTTGPITTRAPARGTSPAPVQTTLST